MRNPPGYFTRTCYITRIALAFITASGTHSGHGCRIMLCHVKRLCTYHKLLTTFLRNAKDTFWHAEVTLQSLLDPLQCTFYVLLSVAVI